MAAKSGRFLGDAVYVGILILYALAGVRLAPFHGDEATTMYVARDWYTIFVNHDLSNILYRTDLTNQTLIDAQEFRLRMGASARYAIGFFTNVMGMNASDLTDPWFWGADYNDNAAHGHLGKPPVLFITRLASAFLLVISIAGMFQIGKRLGGKQYGRMVAWIATFIYAMTPTLLLNGRRAIYEGSTALFTVLLIIAGLEIIRRARLQPMRGMFVAWLLFGIVAGAAIAGKNSLALVVLPIGGLAALIGWWFNRQVFVRLVAYGLASVVAAGVVFLGLNPAWWSQPLAMPAIVFKLNTQLFHDQAGYYGGWTSLPARAEALVAFPFQDAQYYEAGNEWQAWIGDQIATYEHSGLYGIAWANFGIITYALMALGVGVLLFHIFVIRQADKLFLLGTLVGIAAAVFIATPLPWQRYYILLIAPWSLTVSFGVAWVVRTVQKMIADRSHPVHNVASVSADAS